MSCEKSTAEMNPRWLAFCRATQTDTQEYWDARLGVRFITWVTNQIEPFAALHPQYMASEFIAPSKDAQDAFTAFLEARPIEEPAP